MQEQRVGPNKLTGTRERSIFCNDYPRLTPELQAWSSKEELKHVSVTTHTTQGPPRYRIAKDAELTVAVYENRNKVIANFVLDSDDLTAARTSDITKALARVLP